VGYRVLGRRLREDVPLFQKAPEPSGEYGTVPVQQVSSQLIDRNENDQLRAVGRIRAAPARSRHPGAKHTQR
jgi:hypothetical protein